MLKIPTLLCSMLLLSCFLYSCGEEEGELNDSVDTSANAKPQRLPELDPTTAWPDYNPEDKEAFEEAVYRQHLHLMGQVSKRAIDSIMKVHLLSAKDLKAGKEKANLELTRWMERQDTLSRRALANQFAISRDSVDAILQKWEE